MQSRLRFSAVLVTVLCLLAPVAFAQKPDRAGNPLDKIVELENQVAALEAQLEALGTPDSSSLAAQLTALQEQVEALSTQLAGQADTDADLQSQIDAFPPAGGGASNDVAGATYQFTDIGGYVGNSFNSVLQVSMSNKSFSYTFNTDGTVSALYESCALIDASIAAGGSSVRSSVNFACPTAALTWTQDSGLVTVSNGGNDLLFAVSSDGSSMVSAPQLTMRGAEYFEQRVQMGVRLGE